jgi:oligo-alginate lyase
VTPTSRRAWLRLQALMGMGGLAGLGIASPWSQAASPSPRAHPRLLVGDADWASLSARRQADEDLDRLVLALLARARRDLALPVIERQLEGRRLLRVSRELIRRTLQWAFAWRVTGERVFVERARRDMLAVAAFADWNPDHFLDVAEMTAGLAIGYDWLFDELPADERATLRGAIVGKGIAQARHGHRTFRAAHNWSQVCIGGMVLGALAVQDDEPDLAHDLLAAARKDVLHGLHAYGPDGAYPEGPGYWTYGTTYSVLLVAALRGAGLTDWGVLAAPGFARSAEFYAQSIGPSGRHFNYADSNEGQELASPIVYLARELDQPALLNAKRGMARANQGLAERFAPLAALWWPAGGSGRSGNALPLSYAGQGPQPLAIWRTSWTDPNALWFAIKGGGGAYNHAHLDAGSFVLDLDGLRWARDLGMQDYNSLESRGIALWDMKPGSARWKVFRLSAEAHNTLTLDGRPHIATAMASLVMANEREALIDLAPVLGLKVATRRARFADDAVVLQDRIAGATPGMAVRWALCTEADIRLDGSTAFLTQKGRALRVRFEGQAVQLAVLDISRPRSDFDHPNPGTRQLVATAPVAADGSWQLTTRFARA